MSGGVLLFGGAFNPPHRTHARVLEAALAHSRAQRAVVLPSGHHPHRQDDPDMADAAHRLAMCRLAFDELDRVVVDDREMHRVGPSYTVDTLREFRAALPAEQELFWLLGADNLRTFDTWHEPAAILGLATILTVPREGEPLDDAVFEDLALPAAEKARLRAHVLHDVTADEVAATRIRAALARGDEPPDLHPEVLRYVRRHHLYGA